MKIYIDQEYKCHVSPGDNRREFEVSFFDNKCPEFIEGYRYVPEGEVFRREDGEMFSGEMVAPFKRYYPLYIAQLEYELQDADKALERLGV